MNNFFQSDTCTTFWNPNTCELWIFGDAAERITEKTPHIFVDRVTQWGDGSEEETELPVTDGHGNREWQTGKIYECDPAENNGTTAESAIKKFWNYNA